MIAPVVIEFLAKGIPQVQQAFKSIENAAIRAERAQSQSAERGARTRVSLAKREAQDKEREYSKLAKQTERWQREEVKATQRAERDKERLVAQHARQQVRIRQQAEREVERIGERGRAAARRQLAFETRDREAATRKWVRDRELADRRMQQDQARFRRGMFGSVAQGAMAGTNRVANTAVGLASTMGQIGGGFGIADSVQRQIGATRLAGNIAASTVGQNVTSKEILNAGKATGARFGLDTEDAISGIDRFKNVAGDTKRGIELLPQLAELATAFGADVGDLAENAANIAVSDDKLSNADIMKLLRVQVRQGAEGSVEIADMAKYGSRLTAGASYFGGDRAESIGAVGAMAQVARKGGASTAAEATMAAMRFSSNVAQKSEALKSMGIETSDGKGGLRSARDIVKQMLEKTGGDVTKLSKIGLGLQGNKVLTGFSNIYRNAGGGEAGKAAVLKEWEKFTKDISDQEVKERAAKRMLEADKKLEQTFVQLRQQVGEELLPVFIEMIPAIRDMIPPLIEAGRVGIPAFVDLMRSVGNFATAHKDLIRDIAAHPIGTLMALEIGKAALPSLLTRLFTQIFARVNIPPPVPGGGVGGVGGAAAVIGAGVVAGAATKAWVDSGFDEDKRNVSGRVSNQIEARNLTSKVLDGHRVDPKKADELRNKLAKDIENLKGEMGNPGAVKLVTGAIGNIVAPEATAEAQQIEYDNQVKALRASQEALDQLTAALKKAASAANDNKPPPPRVNNGARSEPIINR